jgi:mannonate dehydratase
MPEDRNAMLSRRRFLLTSGAVAGGIAAHSTNAGAGPQTAPPPALRGPIPEPPIKIAEIFAPPENQLWRLVKQSGVNHVVGTFSRRPASASEEKPWSYSALERLKERYAQGGFELAVIESRPPTDKIKLGLPGRDEQIEDICELIRSMGALGVPVWCYEWMPVFNWTRTATDIPSRGGALVSGFDRTKVLPAANPEASVTEDQLWANLKYFLERVIPVAEKANVNLAMHPDDPPLSPLRGLPRIMRSLENYQRLLELVASPVNGITFCQGNFALMTQDVPAAIRHFGKQKKIFFVHLRDVRGTVEKFEETFHDAGQTNMAACMCAYRDIGFAGVCRPDHVPTMAGDSNDRPGYSMLGRLFAIGYIRGLIQSVYSE